ncbi:MAG: HesB/IscA family protein [Acidobacteriaceae bacterium]
MNKMSAVNANLTQAAEKFIRRMLRFSVGPAAGFRLKVRPGGCSGLATEFDLASEPGSNEVVWEYAGLRLFVDASSCVLLNGATVDFAESFSHTGFVITTQGAGYAGCTPSSALVSIEAILQRSYT